MSIFKKKEEQKEIAVVEKREIMEMNETMISKLVLKGDLSAMTPEEKVQYYNIFCNNLGLNPITQPFKIIVAQGKQVLYATKSATEQLRKLNNVSIYDMKTEMLEGICKVTAYGIDKHGRKDVSTGAVTLTGLLGENLANAMMKAETKAKRRLTLSLCGLGIMDESEVEGLPMEDITPTPEPLNEEREHVRQAVETLTPRAEDTYDYNTIKKSAHEAPAEPKDVTEPLPEQVKKPEPPTISPASVFKEIMAIVNGKTLTSQQKMDTIKLVMPAKGNLAELQRILNNIKGGTG